MKVLKFGGTSVGTIESLKNVKKIVEGVSGRAVVVVSALGGLTDNLIATASLARDNSPEVEERLKAIAKRHYDIIDALVPEKGQEGVRSKISELLSELSQLYAGIALIRDLPRYTLDNVVALGERMSSIIVSQIISGARHADSLQFIKTERWFKKNIANIQLTERLIHERFDNCTEQITVCGGFISTDVESGRITNLGRGGSDYTAAIIAATLDAEVLEIWTDVDGFMTADPRIIKDAYVVNEMSFVESMELCTFGAKVIYPPTIYPVFHKNIPIKILNTFNPTAPGTLITDKCGDKNSLKGVSAIRGTSLISVAGSGTSNVASINSRIFNALAKKGISVLLVSQAGTTADVAFSVYQADAENAAGTLLTEFAPEIATGEITEIVTCPDTATIALVGEHIRQYSGIGARVLNTLQRDGIQPLAAADGASETSITLVVDNSKADATLNLLHQSFLSR